jgi:hypothetical protein
MRSRDVLTAGALGILLPLAACATGENQDNRYEIVGTVDEIGDESFNVTDITVIDAEGSATDRLQDDETIHDNFRGSSCIGNESSNDFDELVDSGQIAIGSIVRVVASVGRSKVSCTAGSNNGYYQERSILESVTIEP